MLVKITGVLEMMVTQLVLNYGVNREFEDPRPETTPGASTANEASSENSMSPETKLPRKSSGRAGKAKWTEDVEFKKKVKAGGRRLFYSHHVPRVKTPHHTCIKPPHIHLFHRSATPSQYKNTCVLSAVAAVMYCLNARRAKDHARE